MDEQQNRQREEAARLDRQQTEQHTAEGRQLEERQRTEERQRQEQRTQEDERRRQDRQRQDTQRREEERRREEENRRHEQRAQEERRRQGQEPRKEQGDTTHDSTVRTMQDGRKESEQSTIEYAQKRGVPIAIANLSMSGRSHSEGGRTPQDGKTEPAEQKPATKTPQGKKESPAMKKFRQKQEAMKSKVAERLKSQAQDKSQGHGR